MVKGKGILGQEQDRKRGFCVQNLEANGGSRCLSLCKRGNLPQSLKHRTTDMGEGLQISRAQNRAWRNERESGQ